MITLPSSVLTLLDAGKISVRGLMRFDFGTGTYGFTTSIQPIVYNGLTYQPGGVIKVSDFADSIGLAAQQFTISLSTSPDDTLTPAVLQTIENEDYRDRPVTIYDAFFDPATGALLFVQAVRRGYVDTIDHIDTQDTGYSISANCETRALDYTRTNGRKRTDLDQKRRNPGDTWFLHSSMRGREIVYWGRAAVAQAGVVQAVSSFIKGAL